MNTAILQKLRAKIARNRSLPVADLVSKGATFAASTLTTAIRLRRVNRVGLGVRTLGAPWIENAGFIEIGDHVLLDSRVTPIEISVRANATLTIGSDGFINHGAWLGCTGSIRIGRRVLIGPGVSIIDNGFHDLYVRGRLPEPRPVTIEDDVFLATKSSILPGVTIGRGAVVGAASVVTRNVPPFTVVGGQPATVLRSLDTARFREANPDLFK